MSLYVHLVSCLRTELYVIIRRYMVIRTMHAKRLIDNFVTEWKPNSI